jgi:DNA-binding NarL/FixJ family response regulator
MLESAMQQPLAEFAVNAIPVPAGAAPQAGYVRTTAVLLLSRKTLLGECMAMALSAELPALGVVAMGPDEPRRWQRCSFEICVLSAQSADDAALAEDLKLLAKELPQVPVVVVSDTDASSLVSVAVRHGARGFFSTSASLQLLVQGIRLVLLGGTALPAIILAEAAPSHAPEAPAAEDRREASWTELELFTPRETQVLRTLAAGRPNKLIAHELSMCETTVKVHLRHIFRKLGCTNRTHAALIARDMIEEAS